MITPRSWGYMGGCAACLVIMAVLLHAVTAKGTFNTNFDAGYACFLKGNFEGSAEYFEKIRSLYPARTEIVPMLAAAYFYAGRYEKARGLFSEEEDSAAGKTGKILCDFMLRRRKKKDVDFSSVEEGLRAAAPDDPNVAANLLALRALQGKADARRLEESLRLFDEKIAGNPRVDAFPLALAYNARGCLLASAGRFAEAAVDFERAAKFIPVKNIRTLLERNETTAYVLDKLGKGARKQDLLGLKKRFRILKKTDRAFALLALAAAYLRVGELNEAKKIVESFKPSSPVLEERLEEVKMQLYRCEGLRGKRAREQAYPNLALLIEKKLEGVESGKAKPGENLRAMIYFLAGYYHAHNEEKREAALLEKACTLYPRDFSFLRNRGVYLLRNGRVEEGCVLLRKSLALNKEQKDVEELLRGMAPAPISLRKVHIFTGEPFSHRRPLVHVTFRKGPLQPPPVVRRVLLGTVPLRYVLAGNTIVGSPPDPLPEGFSRYTVKVETAGGGGGKPWVGTITASQDLTLPEIRIVSPARDAVVPQFSFKVDLAVSDAESGVDLSSLVVAVRLVSKGGHGFRFFVVKDGVYKKVRRKRGKKVESSGHVKVFVPLPVPGEYELFVSVSDKAYNRREIKGWTFKAR